MISENDHVTAAASWCVGMTVEFSKIHACYIQSRMLDLNFTVDIVKKLHPEILEKWYGFRIYMEIKSRLFRIDQGEKAAAECDVLGDFLAVYNSF